jgi:hypothetical protein
LEVIIVAKAIIFLSGPPKTGKSRLRGEIYEILRIDRSIRWFVLPASPDMEGQWVNDSWRKGKGEAAESLARKYKGVLKESGAFFSPEWVGKMRKQVEGLVKWADILVIDLGGLPSEQNRQIIEPALASGAYIIPVVLLRDDGDGGWAQFWRNLGYEPIIARYNENLAVTLVNFVA